MSFQWGLQGGERLQGLKRLSRHGVWHWPSGSLLLVPPAHMQTSLEKGDGELFCQIKQRCMSEISVAVFLTAAPGYCSTSPALKLLTDSAPRWHFLSSRNSAELTFKCACATTKTQKRCKRIGIK